MEENTFRFRHVSDWALWSRLNISQTSSKNQNKQLLNWKTQE